MNSKTEDPFESGLPPESDGASESSGPIRVLNEETVLVDWGPTTLTVSAWDGGLSRPVIAVRAASAALDCLSVLSDFQEFLKRRSGNLPTGRPLPEVVRRAFSAALSVSLELTPLSAVAGAVSDEIADRAESLGADRVIVNNGGDIAIRLDRNEQAVVGIRSDFSGKSIGRLVVKAGAGIGGVATSGWRGRSLSSGIADTVTVWARNAALADAAATFIAGGCIDEGLDVKMIRAREIDPSSDLGDTLVTADAPPLSPGVRTRVLKRGAALVDQYIKEGIVRGCLIEVQGDIAAIDPDGFLD